MNTNLSKSEMLKWFFNIAIPVIILCVPCGDVFTVQMKLFFASTIFAILCFAFETINQTVISLLLPLFWVFFGVADAATAFSPWTQYIPWVSLSGLLLAAALERTGLLQRIAYWALIRTGGSYAGIIWGIAIVSMLATIVIGGNTVFPLCALTYGICVALETGKSKTTAGIMMTAAICCLSIVGTTLIGPMIPMGVGMAITGPLQLLGFFESLMVNAPIYLYVFIVVFIISKICKPENGLQGKEYFQSKLDEMGAVSKQEIKAAVILIIYLVYIITKDIHQLSLEWGLAIIPIFMTFPGINCATKEDVKNLNFGLIFFIAACMAIGSVAGSLGVGQIMVNFFLPLLDGAGFYTFFLIEFLVFFLCNFVMTPLAMAAGFSVPFASLAVEMGINPMAVYYFMVHSYDQVILPYEYALYLIFFAFGMIHMKDFIKIMGIKTVVAFVVLFAVLLPWWQFLGFIYV